jgi:predicted CXXCH cytochrome family protein
MRKITLTALLAAIGMLMISSVAFAAITAGPGDGIKGSAHDLSFATGQGTAWGVAGLDSLDRICIFCHAPHHAYKLGDPGGLDYYPLWNHAVTTTVEFTGYSNTDMGAPIVPTDVQHQLNAGIDGQITTDPGGASKLCLSCHDGSVAIAQYGFAPSSSIGSSTGPRATSASRIYIGGAGDLTNHHPIGFDYAAVITAGDDEINPITSPLIGSTRGLTIGSVLYGGKVECGSCHDVHNTKNDGAKLLWVEDTGSALCFSCHAK